MKKKLVLKEMQEEENLEKRTSEKINNRFLWKFSFKSLKLILKHSSNLNGILFIFRE